VRLIDPADEEPAGNVAEKVNERECGEQVGEK
jgi:hypothetical protein